MRYVANDNYNPKTQAILFSLKTAWETAKTLWQYRKDLWVMANKPAYDHRPKL